MGTVLVEGGGPGRAFFFSVFGSPVDLEQRWGTCAGA